MGQHDRVDEDVPCVAGVNGRLSEAETDREPLELIFSVRGTVCRVVGRHPGRWRVRTSEGHVVTFRPEFVVAVNRPKGRYAESSDPGAPAKAPDAGEKRGR
jgi:hypothetical protein